MAVLDVGQHFKRLAQFRDAVGWSAVGDVGPEWEVDQCAIRATTVLRFRRVSSVPLEQLLAVTRPEFRCQATAVMAPLRCRVVELLSPGDALIEVGGMSKALNDMELQACRVLGFLLVSTDVSQQTVLRSTTWRDFPEEGQFAVVCVRSDADSAPRRTQNGGGYYICAESVGDGGCSTLLEHFVQIPLPSIPQWGIALLQGHLDAFGKHVAAVRNPAAGSMYVIASLRSCARGPPLLPLFEDGGDVPIGPSVHMGDHTWVEARRSDFDLPRYLQRMLIFAKADACRVFDRLDGRKIAPYQAAIHRAGWEAAQESFQRLFRTQRSAYRRLYGGKSAPKIYFGASPSFLSGSAEAPQVLDLVVRRNTFLEWAEHQVMQPRVAECSARPPLAPAAHGF